MYPAIDVINVYVFVIINTYIYIHTLAYINYVGLVSVQQLLGVSYCRTTSMTLSLNKTVRVIKFQTPGHATCKHNL